MSDHVEIESTFDVDAAFRIPDLLDLPGVATVEHPQDQHLEAQYVDTADLRLLRAGITLRRRTGGHDAGWHLKLPVAEGGGSTARLEVHRPLGRSARNVPIALSRLVQVRVRSEPLVPSARLTTHRRITRLLDADGRVLAELADDEVLAEAYPAPRPGISGETLTTSWREIEVELVLGEHDLLAAAGDRLLAAGARPAPIGSKAARALQTRLAVPPSTSPAPAVAPRRAGKAGRAPAGPTAAELLGPVLAERVGGVLGWDPHLRAQTPGATETLRLATRELRSLLAGLSSVLSGRQVATVRPGLRRLGGLLAELRASEVLHERIIRSIAALPPDLILGPVTRRADVAFSTRSREALDALLGELETPGYLELAGALEALAAAPRFTGRASSPADGVLAGIVRDHLKKVGSAVEALTVVPRHEEGPSAARARTSAPGLLAQAHETKALRTISKAVKRARFVTEVGLPVAGPGAAPTLESLIVLQNVVAGQRHGVAMREALRGLGLQASIAGQNAFTFGLLHGLEIAADAAALEEIPSAWKAVRRSARAWPG